MLVRPKRAFVAGMLVLYAGMMLFGQGLHHLLGCDHEHALQSKVPHSCPSTAVRAVAAVEHGHDADNCPICQFQAQGQLATTSVGSELKQTVVAVPPLYSPPLVAVFALGIPGPRPPPCV